MFDYIPPPSDEEGEGLSLRSLVIACAIGLVLWTLVIYGIASIGEAMQW